MTGFRKPLGITMEMSIFFFFFTADLFARAGEKEVKYYITRAGGLVEFCTIMLAVKAKETAKI